MTPLWTLNIVHTIEETFSTSCSHCGVLKECNRKRICWIEVKVKGDLDLRGTLGISKEAPVGFETIRVRFEIDAPEATAEQLLALHERAEQYCVVMQTLTKPPKLEVDWSK